MVLCLLWPATKAVPRGQSPCGKGMGKEGKGFIAGFRVSGTDCADGPRLGSVKHAGTFPRGLAWAILVIAEGEKRGTEAQLSEEGLSGCQ